MDKQEERLYWQRKFAGMQQVEQMEIARAAKMTLSEKYDELAALFEAARHFPKSATEEAEIAVVRERWRHIKGGSK